MTDHNTIRGALKTKGLADKSSLTVVVGAEIATNLGDVIGFFLSDEIESREYNAVIEEIRAQNGVVYLPHPFSSSTKLAEMDVRKFDAIEAVNGRKPQWQNKKAGELVVEIGTTGIGGSDTHLLFELGCVYNQTETPLENEDALRELITNRDFQIIQNPLSPRIIPVVRVNHYLSWIRAKKYGKFLERSRSMVQKIAYKIGRGGS